MSQAVSSETSQRHINPRWVQTVLRDRGLPVPTVKQLESAMAQLPDDSAEKLRERIQRLHKASETSDEMTSIADWARGVQVLTVTPAPAANEPSAPREAHSAKSNSPKTAGQERWEPSHHVYGTKAAATFEPTVIEAVHEVREAPFHTLMVEMAQAETKGRYDWERKIVFRLTRRELPLFVAWLFGWCSNLEFGAHGQANDKALILEDQQTHLFMKLKQGRRLLAVQIGGEEIAAVSAMALKAMHMNEPWIDSQTLLQIAKRAGSLYARSVAARTG